MWLCKMRKKKEEEKKRHDCWLKWLHKNRNSIAFGSAPRREAASQPISQLVRQAVSHAVSQASRQADRQIQPNSLGVFSDGFGYKHWRAHMC